MDRASTHSGRVEGGEPKNVSNADNDKLPNLEFGLEFVSKLRRPVLPGQLAPEFSSIALEEGHERFLSLGEFKVSFRGTSIS